MPNLIDQAMEMYSFNSGREIQVLKQLLKEMNLRIEQLECDLDDTDDKIRDLQTQVDGLYRNDNHNHGLLK